MIACDSQFLQQEERNFICQSPQEPRLVVGCPLEARILEILI